jgi:phosphate uptake regulator
MGEIRKIQQVGHSTLVVTIPKKWADEMGLRAGQQVNLEREADDSIRIHTEKVMKKSGSTCNINVDEYNATEMLARALIGIYLSGRNTIRVYSEKGMEPHHTEQIRCVTQSLTGLGIIEQASNEVIIHDILDSTKFPFENLIRHMFKIIAFIEEILVKTLDEFDNKLSGEITNLEIEIDRVYWLTIRQLLLVVKDSDVREKIGIQSLSDAVGYTLIVKSLEEIADHYEDIGRTIANVIDNGLEVENKNLTEIKQYFMQLYGMSDEVMQTLLTRDGFHANDLINTIEDILNGMNNTSKRLLEQRNIEEYTVENNSVLLNLIEIACQNRNILETIINQCMNSSQDIRESKSSCNRELVEA